MISVCIATYNGERFLGRQLQSILEQLGELDEVIISDDSSTDRTLEIVRSFNDPRIRIFEGQTFRNAIFNFEYALRQARHDSIFLSDQDDEWEPGKVKRMSDALQQYDMVVTDHSVVDDHGRVILPSYFERVPSGPGLLRNLKKNTYYGCCMAFRRTVLEVALPFPQNIPMHDIWLGFVADLFFKATFIDYPYTRYRKHSDNVSTATDIVSTATLTAKIGYRWNIIRYLPTAILRKFKQK